MRKWPKQAGGAVGREREGSWPSSAQQFMAGNGAFLAAETSSKLEMCLHVRGGDQSWVEVEGGEFGYGRKKMVSRKWGEERKKKKKKKREGDKERKNDNARVKS